MCKAAGTQMNVSRLLAQKMTTQILGDLRIRLKN
jgi:hypothetical protein